MILVNIFNCSWGFYFPKDSEKLRFRSGCLHLYSPQLSPYFLFFFFFHKKGNFKKQKFIIFQIFKRRPIQFLKLLCFETQMSLYQTSTLSGPLLHFNPNNSQGWNINPVGPTSTFQSKRKTLAKLAMSVGIYLRSENLPSFHLFIWSPPVSR